MATRLKSPALVLAVVGLVVGAGMGMAQRSPMGVPSPPRTLPVAESVGLYVHVVGWVNTPGVVEVPAGSLVVDAVSAAGGLRPGARVEAVNLAAEVAAGQQVVVPGPGDETPSEPGAGKVAINRASATELASLPGVGPVLASRIVAYRHQNGPFAEIEDLLDVSGIGEAKLASLRDLVSLN